MDLSTITWASIDDGTAYPGLMAHQRFQAFVQDVKDHLGTSKKIVAAPALGSVLASSNDSGFVLQPFGGPAHLMGQVFGGVELHVDPTRSAGLVFE